MATTISGSSVYYAGGGGGGGNGTNRAGGQGGGGTGGNLVGSNATNGAANTGGGGGGAGLSSVASGGSGVVIISYSSLYRITIGAGLTGSTATSGSNKITTFTSGTGTVSFALAANYVRTSVAGYFVGGYNSQAPAYSNVVDKLAFSSETISTLTAMTLSLPFSGAGFANSGVAGYVGGWYDGTTGYKWSLPTDTRSTLQMTSEQRYACAGFSNTAVAGYVAGGHDVNAGDQSTKINKIAFPADTFSTSGSVLTVKNYYSIGSSDYGVAGFTFGGTYSSTTVDKIAFPSDTVSSVSGGLSSASTYSSGFADSGTAAYVLLNNANSYGTAMQKFAFPSMTRTTLSATVVTATWQSGGNCNIGVAGYIAGGSSAGGSLDVINRFALPAETRSVLTAVLSVKSQAAEGTFSDCGEF